MARRVQALLGFKEQYVDTTVAAQVIGTSGSEQSRILYIDKGSKDGIKTGYGGHHAHRYRGQDRAGLPRLLAGSAHQRSIQRRRRCAEVLAPAGYLEGLARRRDDAAICHERREGRAGRRGHHQRRRPNLSQGLAGRQSRLGRTRQRSVPQHSCRSRSPSRSGGGSAGGHEDHREDARHQRSGAASCIGYFGRTTADGSQQARG